MGKNCTVERTVKGKVESREVNIPETFAKVGSKIFLVEDDGTRSVNWEVVRVEQDFYGPMVDTPAKANQKRKPAKVVYEQLKRLRG